MPAIDSFKTRLLFFLFYVGLSVLTRAALLPVEVFDLDETANIVGSWEFLRGKLLYTDFVDNKPPLLYVYYALAQIIFGKGLFGVHLFTVLLTVPLTAYAVSAFFDHHRSGIAGAILYLFYSASFLAHDMHAAHTEVLMMLPGSWAIVLLRKPEYALQIRRVVFACFLIGMAVLMKYQIVFWLASIGLVILYRCPSFKRLLLLTITGTLSFAVPLLLAYFMFALAQGEKWMLYWTILNNLFYSANPISTREAIGRFASYGFPFLIATSPLWFFSYRSIPTLEGRYCQLLVSSLILVSIPPVLMGFRFFPHYFIQLYVPLALGAAPYAASLLQRPLSRSAKMFAAYTLTLFFGFTVANMILYYYTTVYRETDPVFARTAQRLKRDPCYTGGTLFVWGYAPILYYYAELPAASRFVVLSQSYLTGYISGNLASVSGKISAPPRIKQEHWDLLMEDLEKSRATYILDTSPPGIYRWNHYPVRNFPRLADYLQRYYQPIDTVEGIVLYRRKDCQENSDLSGTTHSH